MSAEDKVLKKENKTLGTSLYFQFGWGVENGIEAVLPHFLFLNRDESQDVAGLEVCMVHRRHVTVFDVECDDSKCDLLRPSVEMVLNFNLLVNPE